MNPNKLDNVTVFPLHFPWTLGVGSTGYLAKDIRFGGRFGVYGDLGHSLPHREQPRVCTRGDRQGAFVKSRDSKTQVMAFILI